MQEDRGRKQGETAVSPLANSESEWVILGRVSGLFGVRGWVKVFSDTSPRTNILEYASWYLKRSGGWEAFKLIQGKSQGKGIIAKLEGCDDRDQAAELIGADIAITRDQLPAVGPDEFYWSDLEGLQVQTKEGRVIGEVDYLFETGANDVMVVKGDRQRLIPFIPDVILEVSLDQQQIVVDWDPEF